METSNSLTPKLCNVMGEEDCDFRSEVIENNTLKIVEHLTQKHGFPVKRGEEINVKLEIQNNDSGRIGTPLIWQYGVSKIPFRTSFIIIATLQKHVVSWHCVFIGDSSLQKSDDFLVKLRMKSCSAEVNDLRWRIPSISLLEINAAIKSSHFPIPLSLLRNYYTNKESGSVQIVLVLQRLTSPDMRIGLNPLSWKLQIPWKNPWKHLYDSSDFLSETFDENLGKEVQLQNSLPKPVTFDGVTCSVCEISPIQTKWYRCMQCNFNLCDKCMDNKQHKEHILAVIQTEEQKDVILARGTQYPNLRKILDDSYHSSLLPPKCCGISNEETQERCGSQKVQLICLQCRYLFLCEKCACSESHNRSSIPVSVNDHSPGHIFALTRTMEQRKLIKGYLIYFFPLL